MKYYVYQLIDPRDGVVFYVGKGQTTRMYQHSPGSDNKVLGVHIREILNADLKVKYKKVFSTNDERAAYKCEIKMIKRIGLENLCNVHPGGNGVIFTDEIRNKMRGNQYGKGNKGKTHSVETINKMSESHKNMSLETRLKMSEAKKGHTPWSKGKTSVYSRETLKKMSEARIKWWNNKQLTLERA